MRRGDALWEQFTQFIEGEIASRLFGHVMEIFFMTAPASLLIQRFRGKLRDWRDTGIVFASLFAFIFVGFLAISPKSSRPEFVGELSNVVPASGSNKTDSSIVMAVTVINKGDAQSVPLKWSVEADIGGSTFKGDVLQIPEELHMTLPDYGPTTPLAATFYSKDDILKKSTAPINAGAALNGYMLAKFKGIPESAFHNGALIKVSFEDVYSKKYSMTFKTSAQGSPIGAIPGLNTTFSCRVPQPPIGGIAPIK